MNDSTQSLRPPRKDCSRMVACHDLPVLSFLADSVRSNGSPSVVQTSPTGLYILGLACISLGKPEK